MDDSFKENNSKYTSLDSYKRVKLALMHKEADKIPLDIGGTRVTGIHIKAYQKYRQNLGLPFSEPKVLTRFLQVAEVENDFRDILGVDIESINPRIALEESEIKKDNVRGSEGISYRDRWNCGWFNPEGGNYFDLYSFPLAEAETVQDIEKFTWPNEASEAILSHYTESAREIVNNTHRAVVLGRTNNGIFEMFCMLQGYEKAYLNLALNETFSEALLDKLLELKLVYYRGAIKRLLDANVEDFIISESDDLGTQRGLVINPDMYRQFIKPRHTELFKQIKGYSKGRAHIELHCCGAIRTLIPDFIESGIEILNPVQVGASEMDDTRGLKRDFGDSIVFHGGGIDTQSVLSHGTTQNVKDEVKRRMEDLAPGGGFIFTPVHCIQPDVPYDNFIAMLEAFRDNMRY